MRRAKYILFSVICFLMIGVVGFQIFGAVAIGINQKSSIKFTAEDIGAKILGVTRVLGINEVAPTYVNFAGAGEMTDYVYTEKGTDVSSSKVSADLGNINMNVGMDQLQVYVYIKNIGSRYIVPRVSVSSTSNIACSNAEYYFDISEGNVDPIAKKTESATATAFTDAITAQITDGNVGAFTANSSIDNYDTYLIICTLKTNDDFAWTGGSTGLVTTPFTINIEFSADIQYTSDKILSVYQTMGQQDPAWTKFGFNSTLNVSATKVETNSTTLLQTALESADDMGNANIAGIGSSVQVGVDDYSTIAPVYKDIDIVNIDIATGEVVGKLSDLNYNFEWYGREITLPAGTTLASGRTLEAQESFTVDVYTYYPEMYIRRWAVGNQQWISLSDKDFRGAVHIPAYYTATFEAFMFNPDKTLATNDNGIILRSYVSDYINTSKQSEYLISHYGYTNPTSVTIDTYYTQANMLKYCTNLTKAWETYLTNNPAFANYTIAKSCQGENYNAFIYNLMYLVKYADNNSQAKVGYGNTYTYMLYNATDMSVIDGNGETVVTGENNVNSYAESIKGATIGLYNGTNQNSAKMYYGYQVNYTNSNDKTGLYPTQFLPYNTGTKRYLRDGYVGSDKYTAVFCLGQCNPWGNAFKWIFGTANISDGEKSYIYVNYSNYNYKTNNYVTTTTADYNTNVSKLTSAGYIPLSYTTPTTVGYYSYCDISIPSTDNGLESLIGMPSEGQVTSTNGTARGLCDYYYKGDMSNQNCFGVLRGGYPHNASDAGAFYFGLSAYVDYTYYYIACRVSLTI